jgi:magnesium transporter
MSRPRHRRSRKAGLLPGTPVHIGTHRGRPAGVTLVQYDAEQIREREIHEVTAKTVREQPGVTWIDVEGVHEVALLEQFAQAFGLHPLVIEDIANTSQRPKLEDYGDYLYIVVRMLSWHAPTREAVSEQVSLILGPDFVLSFQEGLEGDAFDPIRERLRTAKGRLRREGADYLVYSLIDAVVDGYFVVLERLGEEIERLDEQLAGSRTVGVARAIQLLKREMIYLRRAVWPLRETINGLLRAESTLVRPSTAVYLKDVYDHTVEVIDTVETDRDVLTGMLENHLSLLTTRLNEVMKVLTVIATVFIPLSFITGIYGMNFRHMPELEWPWGYPLVLAVMAAIGAGMLVYFWRKRWL